MKFTHVVFPSLYVYSLQFKSNRSSHFQAFKKMSFLNNTGACGRTAGSKIRSWHLHPVIAPPEKHQASIRLSAPWQVDLTEHQRPVGPLTRANTHTCTHTHAISCIFSKMYKSFFSACDVRISHGSALAVRSLGGGVASLWGGVASAALITQRLPLILRPCCRLTVSPPPTLTPPSQPIAAVKGEGKADLWGQERGSSGWFP